MSLIACLLIWFLCLTYATGNLDTAIQSCTDALARVWNRAERASNAAGPLTPPVEGPAAPRFFMDSISWESKR